jgi:N-glycosylase/DNA lyase
MLCTRRLQTNNYTFECIVGITVKFTGEAECQWTETSVYRNGKTEREATIYRGYEKYFENSETLFGGTGELI